MTTPRELPARPTTTYEQALAGLVPDASELASNAWAIGPDRTEDGTTMLVGNPHFPWQGALRFYEAQLTVPGELDVYGVSLLGSPAINIGFTDGVAWSNTVSAGRRFTAYTLDLVPGDPTRYRYGDEERAMTSRTVRSTCSARTARPARSTARSGSPTTVRSSTSRASAGPTRRRSRSATPTSTTTS